MDGRGSVGIGRPRCVTVLMWLLYWLRHRAPAVRRRCVPARTALSQPLEVDSRFDLVVAHPTPFAHVRMNRNSTFHVQQRRQSASNDNVTARRSTACNESTTPIFFTADLPATLYYALSPATRNIHRCTRAAPRSPRSPFSFKCTAVPAFLSSRTKL